MIHIGILIPTFQPTEDLLDLLGELTNRLAQLKDKTTIILVNDGSDTPSSQSVLMRLSENSDIRILHHEKNLGKGAAIKTGVSFAQRQGLDLVITADSDGQHAPKDIIAVLTKAKDTDDFIMGVRRFDKTVPLRSRLGNSLTVFLFKSIFRTSLSDTQSGLRAIPKRLFPELLSIQQNRYEYEFQMLINLCKSKTEIIHEHPIETIYEVGNPTSHFRPIIDSTLIYLVLLRYSLFTLLIALFDLGGFWLVAKIMDPTVAFAITRGITAVIYFFVIRRFVFKAQKHLLKQTIQFLSLVLFNVVVVGNTMSFVMKTITISPVAIYLISSLLFFGFNFWVQKFVIFKK